MSANKIQKKNINFIDEGTGKVIVLLHGFTESLRIWDSFATQLGFNLAPGGRQPMQEHIAAFFGLNDEQATAEFLETCMRWFRMMSEVLDKPR